MSKHFPDARVLSIDINPKALQYGRINAKHLGKTNVEFVLSDGFSAVSGKEDIKERVDVVTINPPFVAGDKRLYAGGGETGKELTLRLVSEAREVLKIGGELWCHVAAPVTFEGMDTFKESLKHLQGWEIVAYEVSLEVVRSALEIS